MTTLNRLGTFALLTTTIVLSLACDRKNTPLPDDPTVEGEEVVSQDVLDAGLKTQAKAFREPQYNSAQRAEALSHYQHLDKNKLVPTVLLEKTILYYHYNLSKVDNKKYIVVIDFSKHSSKTRFFVVNVETGAVQALHTAHGSGSDSANSGYATKFSNASGSNASSLGYYYTAEVYSGKWGRSMRLDGLSTTNSNVRARAVVVHGADYVWESNRQAGRSWGCPALNLNIKDAVITKIMNGAVMYAGLSGQR